MTVVDARSSYDTRSGWNLFPQELETVKVYGCFKFYYKVPDASCYSPFLVFCKIDPVTHQELETFKKVSLWGRGVTNDDYRCYVYGRELFSTLKDHEVADLEVEIEKSKKLFASNKRKQDLEEQKAEAAKEGKTLKEYLALKAQARQAILLEKKAEIFSENADKILEISQPMVRLKEAIERYEKALLTKAGAVSPKNIDSTISRMNYVIKNINRWADSAEPRKRKK